MTNERPLVEGIEAYHQSLKEGARRERKRILKLIDEKIDNSTDPFEIVAYKTMKEQLKK